MDVHPTIHSRYDPAGQLYRQLRVTILDGRLVPGKRLPSTHGLVPQTGVSCKITLDVFEHLIVEGYLQPRTGSGTLVAEAAKGLRVRTPAASPAVRPVSPTPVVRTFDTPRNNMPVVLSLLRANLIHDFAGGVTEKRQFPFDAWRRCIVHALRQQVRRRGGYQDPAGDQALCLAISRYLVFSHAVMCVWAGIIITQGAQQAIDLIVCTLARPGDMVTIEDPGRPPARIALQAFGAKVVLVSVDAEGLAADALPKRAKFVYVAPSHQFPLGVSMSLARRAQLLDRARCHDALIIEDDYDSGSRFDGCPMESLKSLDTTGRVVYVGTFSETIFPELRIGYVVPPVSLVAPLRHARQVVDWHSESFMQAALAKPTPDGNFTKYLHHMHKEYAARRNALLRYLCGPLVPWLAPMPSAAGIHMVAQVQMPLVETELVKLAESMGVGLYDTVRMFVAWPPQLGLLIDYGHVNVAEIDAGLSELAEVLAKVAT